MVVGGLLIPALFNHWWIHQWLKSALKERCFFDGWKNIYPSISPRRRGRQRKNTVKKYIVILLKWIGGLFTISPQSSHSCCCGNANRGSVGAAALSQEGGADLASRAGATHACAAHRVSRDSAPSTFLRRLATRGQLMALAHNGTGCNTAPTTINQSSYSHLKPWISLV